MLVLNPVGAKVGAHLRVLRLLSRNELMVGNLWVHRLLRFKRVDGKSGWCDQSWEYLKVGLREKLGDVCQSVEYFGSREPEMSTSLPTINACLLESKARRDPIRPCPRLADCYEVVLCPCRIHPRLACNAKFSLLTNHCYFIVCGTTLCSMKRVQYASNRKSPMVFALSEVSATH